jgi:hypothetical protein
LSACQKKWILGRAGHRLVIATKAAMGAADPAKGLTMTTGHDETDFEPSHNSSPTSTSFSSMATVPSRTSPIRDRFPKAMP